MTQPNPTHEPLTINALFEKLEAIPVLEEMFRKLEAEFKALKKAQNKPPAPKWLTLKEAAEILKTSTKTVTRYIEAGKLRKSLASRHIRIPAEDVEAFAGSVTVARR